MPHVYEIDFVDIAVSPRDMGGVLMLNHWQRTNLLLFKMVSITTRWFIADYIAIRHPAAPCLFDSIPTSAVFDENSIRSEPGIPARSDQCRGGCF